MVKERIDIEALLEWAYRVQCVEKRVAKAANQRPAILPSSSNFAAVMALGTRVDTSGFQTYEPPGFTVENTGQTDAMRVHDAVLALKDCWLEWRGRDEVVVWTAEMAKAWGYVIEKGTRGWQAVATYAAAGVAHDMVGELQHVSPTVLVILHARQGIRPPHGESVPAHLARRRKAVEIEHDTRRMMEERALYAVWRTALLHLTKKLGRDLATFEPMPPLAPESPWTGRARVVLKALRETS